MSRGADRWTDKSRRVHAERIDVGDPEFVHLSMAGTKPWRCEHITVWKDFRYWVFDCTGQLDFQSPEAVRHMTGQALLRQRLSNGLQSYLLSGNKKYEVSVQTGADPHGRRRLS